jgi:Starch binding domain
VDFGDKVCIVGNQDALGQWNVDNAQELCWGDGDVWTGEVSLPDNEEIEFKLVTVRGGGHLEWEEGENRKLHGNGADMTVDLSSGDVHSGAPAPEQQLSGDSGSESDGGTPEQQHSHNGAGVTSSLDRPLTSAWQGKSVQFMQSNEHGKERAGTWDSSGLEGVLRALVQEDERRGRRARRSCFAFWPPARAPAAS